MIVLNLLNEILWRDSGIQLSGVGRLIRLVGSLIDGKLELEDSMDLAKLLQSSVEK